MTIPLFLFPDFRRACLAAGLAIGFGWISAPAALAQSDAAGLAFFENRIRPILVGGGQKLSGAVIADLVQWVKMGAPYPETSASEKGTAPRLWAFQPVRNPPLPAVKNTTWPSTSVDPFILASIEERGLQPAGPADRRTLIRRATFDLTGLPPTPEEIDAFMADRSPEAFAKVVERLLNSAGYGEHWGRHWLDVVRYADTAGDTADYPLPEAWRYRNYVIDSFNADKPYDAFLREQIAGDILAKQGPRERYAERVAATGYLALARRFGFDSENYHHLTIQDTIDTLGQSVLGLTMGCARCHDHKFDPLSMQDYYGLYGIFESTRYAFPGSEQKGRYRAMIPLVPVDEAEPKWRRLQAGYASLGATPGSVLRSLDDLDGDFEMQRIASGGSYGVLVPPWLYEGKVSVTQEAQSPYKNLYPFGGVGVSVAPDADKYWIKQRFHPSRRDGVLCVNLDFRAATNAPAARGQHRFLIGAQGSFAVVELFISWDALTLSGSAGSIPLPKPGSWHSLQVAVDLSNRTFSGSMGIPGQVIPFGPRRIATGWNGEINYVAIDSEDGKEGPRPGLEFDNIGVQAIALPAVSTEYPGVPATSRKAALNAELQELAGMDGNFEAQQGGTAPAIRWHPGPKSAVQISAAAQSPFRNVYPAGALGIHLPATVRDGYNGFGQQLAVPWKPGQTRRLYASFDFRCGTAGTNGTGTWRYHLGRTHAVPAVELGFNASEFYQRSGDLRTAVGSLQPGEWYQVQLILDLGMKSYTGSLANPAKKVDFAGAFVSGWNGSIDYTFIDSGGHLAGNKPVLDADNFVISETSQPPLDALPALPVGTDQRSSRERRIGELREKIAQLTVHEENLRKGLDAQLGSGPVDLAYGVSEGTPHNAHLQVRGEPERPGAEVPRGFIRVLGGGAIAPGASGSGRMELANWLTQPDNPLTARVMVNRIWQYHFGRALVRTANDFGTRSQPPTHPELLDHLATRFIAEGWSIKAMHRLLMLSATYRQASLVEGRESRVEGNGGNQPGQALDSRLAALDPDNILLSRFPRRRLSAEEIRDSILSVSGALDATPGQEHPFPPPYQWGFSQHRPFAAVYDHDKRSVYLMVQRIKRHPFLALFDGADPNSSTAERRITTVPTQALYFLNDPFVHAKSLKCAKRLQAARATESGQIELASQFALGRAPTDAECAEAVEFLVACRAELAATDHENIGLAALAAYVRTLFSSNEFLHCD